MPSEKAGEANILLGFVAFGSDTSIKKLEIAAAASGVCGGRPETVDGRIEAMIVFDQRTPSATAFDLLGRATRGEFGTLEVETMLAPPSAIKKSN